MRTLPGTETRDTDITTEVDGEALSIHYDGSLIVTRNFETVPRPFLRYLSVYHFLVYAAGMEGVELCFM